MTDARALSYKFCKDFDLPYCQVFYVDILTNEAYGQYCFLDPTNILLLDNYKSLNKLGTLMHELAHHLECYGYESDLLQLGLQNHGYNYQLAKKRVKKWCEKNISIKPNWNKPLNAFQDKKDMIAFQV